MSGSTSRLQAIAAVTNYQPISPPLNFAETPSSEIFGSNVFGLAEMQKRLPKQVFKSLKRTIEKGEKLDCSLADTVASTRRLRVVERERRTVIGGNCEQATPVGGSAIGFEDVRFTYPGRSRPARRGGQFVNADLSGAGSRKAGSYRYRRHLPSSSAFAAALHAEKSGV